MRDSYSSFERRFLDRGRWLVYMLLKPAVFLLAKLRVSPNVVSLAQIGVGLVVYPALFTYLWFGVNWLDGAVSLSIGLMGLVVVQGLFHLRRGMRETPVV